LTKVPNKGDLFAAYINMFLKLEKGSSDYPSWVQTEADKDRYIEEYRRAEGIVPGKAKFLKMRGNGLWQS